MRCFDLKQTSSSCSGVSSSGWEKMDPSWRWSNQRRRKNVENARRRTTQWDETFDFWWLLILPNHIGINIQIILNNLLFDALEKQRLEAAWIQIFMIRKLSCRSASDIAPSFTFELWTWMWSQQRRPCSIRGFGESSRERHLSSVWGGGVGWGGLLFTAVLD